MPDLPTTIDTPAGKLKVGARYNLTLKHGDSERELRRAKVVAFEHTGIGMPGGGTKPGEMVPSEVEVRYQAESADLTVGFLADNVVKAVEA